MPSVESAAAVPALTLRFRAGLLTAAQEDELDERRIDLAVLRPQCWLMIGHCGGLRPSQRIGDYVLAHAYLRDDHVLDEVLPPEIPVPAIAEVQHALARAAA